ncbi:MAG TPA: hypothetical protein VMF58_03910 [Rhizomicrobium sp.]|nr:hypothetical protein [Rhizomicrobium sp.]
MRYCWGMGRGFALLVTATLLVMMLIGCGSLRSAPPLSACTAATAQRVSAQNLARYYTFHGNSCVHVEGVLWERYLYDSVESIYREQAGSNPDVIAVYGGTTAMDDGFTRQRARIDVIGLATSCEQIDADALRDNPGRGVMIVGPCHTFLGAAVVVASYKNLDVEPARLTGPSALAAYGDLTPVAVQAVDAQAKVPAENWFAAARAHDIAKMRDLMGWTAASDDLLAPLAIPTSAVKGAIAYFHHQSRNREDKAQFDVACVCRTENCGGRWPISLVDTAPGPAWPYDCAEILDNSHIAVRW